jgi:hypothetical protein
MINNLKRLGLSDAAAQNLRLAIDILGTGGVGYSVGVKTAVKVSTYIPAGKYSTVSTDVAKNAEYFIPQQSLRVSNAHSINSIGLNTRFGDGNRNTTKTIAKYVKECRDMTHSMSRRGNCWDNAPTERFFRSFKTE